MSAAVRVRFAPSPTGRLHLGNARTALVNWLYARRHGGRFLLRLDDTDSARTTAAAARDIAADLAWLGLDPDATVRQSERLDRYAAALDRLAAAGHAYRCHETAGEPAAARRARRQTGPACGRAGRAPGDGARAALGADGRRPCWRLRLAPGGIAWDDLVRGPVRFDAGQLGDPVLVRADGRPLYALCSAVDDIEFGISHVFRGEDHVTNTAVQIRLFEALGAAPPAFGHLPLLAGAAGGILSKRDGAASLGGLRAEGIEPGAITACLARLGTGRPASPAGLGTLAGEFDAGAIGRAPPRVAMPELRALSARVLREAPFGRVRRRLRDLGLADADAAFWDAVRPNLARLEDACGWHAVVTGPPACRRGADAALLDDAAALLPPEPWDRETWAVWTAAVGAATGQRGRALFLPLRRALTGRDRGPELAALLPLIGRRRTLERLRGRQPPASSCGTAAGGPAALW